MPTQAELQILKERLMAKLPEKSFHLYNYDGDALKDLTLSACVGTKMGGMIIVASIPQDPDNLYLFLDHLEDFPPGMIVKRPLSSRSMLGSVCDLVVTWFKNPIGEEAKLIGSMRVKVGAAVGTYVGCFQVESCEEAFLFIEYVVIRSLVEFSKVRPTSYAAAVAPK